MTWIIVTGNPVDGFRFYGPYEEHLEAGEAGDSLAADSLEPDWWIAQLEKLETEE